VATDRSPEELAAHREILFAAPTPHTRAQAVILEGDAVWLLPGARSAWTLPTDTYRHPDESPAGGVCRVAADRTGLEVDVTALAGLYDSPPAPGRQAYHAYDYVFATRRRGGTPLPGARRFPLDELPLLVPPDGARLAHAVAVARRGARAYFAYSGEVTP
jgi:ADP-ribose pyrophosphatase YjhB (NUDIX family)